MSDDAVGPAKTGGDYPPYYIASVGRALTLVGVFAKHDELTVSGVASALNISPSSAHRLLQMLVYHGFVTQGDHRRYLRGPQFDLFAAAAKLPLAKPEDIAAPLLRQLRDDHTVSVHLVALEGNDARFIAGAPILGLSGMAMSRTGWLLPAHTVAGGKMLLAELSGPALDKLYGDGIPLTRNSSIQSLSQLHRELRTVRQNGYARSVRWSHEEIGALAVTVPKIDGLPAWALSAAWPSSTYHKVQVEPMVEVLHDTARQIAELLNSPSDL